MSTRHRVSQDQNGFTRPESIALHRPAVGLVGTRYSRHGACHVFESTAPHLPVSCHGGYKLLSPSLHS
uniref:Uncharacterized protein n=1 Tax=Zea mays TaxID=4577 RepID=C4J2R3_MAIZE|nr:unknown [Zea mays]